MDIAGLLVLVKNKIAKHVAANFQNKEYYKQALEHPHLLANHDVAVAALAANPSLWNRFQAWHTATKIIPTRTPVLPIPLWSLVVSTEGVFLSMRVRTQLPFRPSRYIPLGHDETRKSFRLGRPLVALLFGVAAAAAMYAWPSSSPRQPILPPSEALPPPVQETPATILPPRYVLLPENWQEKLTGTGVVDAFEFSGATLSLPQKARLATMAPVIQATCGTLHIEGHADHKSLSPTGNQRTSESRAKTVADELRSHGITIEIETAGLSDTDPLRNEAGEELPPERQRRAVIRCDKHKP